MTFKIDDTQFSTINPPKIPEKFGKGQLQLNTTAQNENAINFLANSGGATHFDNPNREKTPADFLYEVMVRQPVVIDDENTAKVRLTMKIDKSPETTTREDYNLAFRRAVYNKAMDGLKLSDEEIKLADKALIDAKLYQTYYNLQGTLDNLKADQQKSGNQMPISVGKEKIEYARRAGQAILQYQKYKAQQNDLAVESGKTYVNEAMGGFVQPLINAPVNIVNGLSEPFRAGERGLFGTNYTPEIPKMSVAERSEYWNKDGRMYANKGGEIAATIAFGGIFGGRAIATQTGRSIIGLEFVYNIGAGIAGKDITQTDARGNARQMEWTERGLRIAGGLFGARQTIKTEIAIPNSITNKAVDKLDDIFKNPPTFKPQGELVTNEGFRIKVNDNTFENVEKGSNVLEMRGDYRINIRIGDGGKGSGLNYAWRRHGPISTPQNKSIFSISKEELKLLLQRKDVIQSLTIKSSTSGNYIRQIDVGKIIGNIPTQKGGQSTSVLTVITDEAGNLVNTFPGNINFGATLP